MGGAGGSTKRTVGRGFRLKKREGGGRGGKEARPKMQQKGKRLRGRQKKGEEVLGQERKRGGGEKGSGTKKEDGWGGEVETWQTIYRKPDTSRFRRNIESLIYRKKRYDAQR